MNWYLAGRKGAQGELLAALDLIERGFEVFRAIDPVASTDLLIHKRGASWRVQVKTGAPETTPIDETKQEIVAWVDLRRRLVRYEPGLPEEVSPMPKKDIDRGLAEIRQKIERAATSAARNYLNAGDVWKAQFRCQSDRCDVRTFEITVKEFDFDPPHVRGPFSCPNCRSAVSLEWARNSHEWSEEERRASRLSVNMQIEADRQRKEKGPDCLVIYSNFSDELPKISTGEEKTKL